MRWESLHDKYIVKGSGHRNIIVRRLSWRIFLYHVQTCCCCLNEENFRFKKSKIWGKYVPTYPSLISSKWCSCVLKAESLLPVIKDITCVKFGALAFVKTSAIFSVPLIWIGCNSSCCFASLIVWSSRASDVKNQDLHRYETTFDEMKKFFFFLPLFWLNFFWTMKYSSDFSPTVVFLKKTQISLSCCSSLLQAL